VELDTVGSRGERLVGFIESDMAVGADAEHLQIDPASVLDFLLIPLALDVEIVGSTVEEVDAVRIEVHAVEQLHVHVSPEAAGM